MKKETGVGFFIAILVAHLAAIALGIPLVEYITKPMLIVMLGLYFLFQTDSHVSVFKKWIVFALAFSWVGDVLLLIQSRDTIFFLLGLSAFLVAHIFYIIFFHNIRMKEKIKGNLWILFPVACYYIVLIFLLSPYLGDMKLPVRIYGIVISFMLMLAMHMLFIKNKKAGQLMALGATLFIISDSILAINKFYREFEFSGVVIMLTYGLAQLLITEGAIQYIRKPENCDESEKINTAI